MKYMTAAIAALHAPNRQPGAINLVMGRLRWPFGEHPRKVDASSTKSIQKQYVLSKWTLTKTLSGDH